MGKGKPTNQQDRQRTHRFVAGVDAFARIAQSFTKWGGLALIACFVYLSISSLSGKTTLASIVVNFLGTLTVSKYAAYAVGGGGCAWAYGERRLRRKRVAELSKRVEELEVKIDPKRSSSTLPSTGTTRTDD
jgi:hypothetical protein